MGLRINPTCYAVVLLICSFGSVASAHDWFIQAVDYALPQPGETVIYQGWGHKLPLDGTLAADKVSHLRVITPNGSTQDLSLQPGRSFHAVPVELKSPGVYTILGESVPGYYQIYRDKEGQVHHTTKALDELTDVGQVFFSCRAFQNPKTQIVVGDTENPAACEPTGAKLEIVPDQPVGTLHAGDRITFSVLLDGAPVADGSIYDATYMGYSSIPEDYLYMERTTMHGKGHVDLCCAGIWYIRVHVTVPAPAELQTKCRNLLYNTTLTLEVRDRVREAGRVTHDD